MFDDIYQTPAEETSADRGDNTFELPLTSAELLFEAGLPPHAIREILGNTADTGAYARLE